MGNGIGRSECCSTIVSFALIPLQACVQRVIKAVLPDNVQIGKDAKAAFSRSAGIFIMWVPCFVSCLENHIRNTSGFFH